MGVKKSQSRNEPCNFFVDNPFSFPPLYSEPVFYLVLLHMEALTLHYNTTWDHRVVAQTCMLEQLIFGAYHDPAIPYFVFVSDGTLCLVSH